MTELWSFEIVAVLVSQFGSRILKVPRKSPYAVKLTISMVKQLKNNKFVINNVFLD